MDTATISTVAVVMGMVLFVLSIGLSAPPGAIRRGFGDRAGIARAMLAMLVAMPALTLLIIWLLPLTPTARVALLTIAVSPMVPPLPVKEQKLGGSIDYALAIQVAASIATLVAAPLVILLAEWIFGRRAGFDAGAVSLIILITVVAPLGAGIAHAAYFPELALRIARPLRLVGTLLLAAAALVVVWKVLPDMLASAYALTLLAIALMIGFGLAFGYRLGGPEEGNRHALALATALRHPGVAIGLATATGLEPNPPMVAVILLYLLAGALLSIPYSRWALNRA